MQKALHEMDARQSRGHIRNYERRNAGLDTSMLQTTMARRVIIVLIKVQGCKYLRMEI